MFTKMYTFNLVLSIVMLYIVGSRGVVQLGVLVPGYP